MSIACKFWVSKAKKNILSYSFCISAFAPLSPSRCDLFAWQIVPPPDWIGWRRKKCFIHIPKKIMLYSRFFSAVFGGVLLSMVTCQVKSTCWHHRPFHPLFHAHAEVTFVTSLTSSAARIEFQYFWNIAGKKRIDKYHISAHFKFRVWWLFHWAWLLSSFGLSRFCNVLSHQAIIGVSATFNECFCIVTFGSQQISVLYNISGRYIILILGIMADIFPTHTCTILNKWDWCFGICNGEDAP